MIKQNATKTTNSGGRRSSAKGKGRSRRKSSKTVTFEEDFEPESANEFGNGVIGGVKKSRRTVLVEMLMTKGSLTLFEANNWYHTFDEKERGILSSYVAGTTTNIEKTVDSALGTKNRKEVRRQNLRKQELQNGLQQSNLNVLFMNSDLGQEFIQTGSVQQTFLNSPSSIVKLIQKIIPPGLSEACKFLEKENLQVPNLNTSYLQQSPSKEMNQIFPVVESSSAPKIMENTKFTEPMTVELTDSPLFRSSHITNRPILFEGTQDVVPVDLETVELIGSEPSVKEQVASVKPKKKPGRPGRPKKAVTPYPVAEKKVDKPKSLKKSDSFTSRNGRNIIKKEFPDYLEDPEEMTDNIAENSDVDSEEETEKLNPRSYSLRNRKTTPQAKTKKS